MGDEQMKAEFPNQDQRLAVCFSKAGESALSGALKAFTESYQGLIGQFQKFMESMGESVTVTREEIVKESVEFGGLTHVKESSIWNVPVKIIGPGWGSMAYYSEAMLKSSGPKAFTKGTHLYWNHPTASEESERPERDLNHLAAISTEDAHWEPNGPKGPGLYFNTKVFSDHAEQLREKGPYIGASIVAAVKSHPGVAEGRSGKIADEFIHGFSTDFVTKAGAKGAPVMESQRAEQVFNQQVTEASIMEETKGTEKAVEVAKEIKEAKDREAALVLEIDNLKSKLADMQAVEYSNNAVAAVSEALTTAQLGFSRKLIERICSAPVIKEGKVDPDWIKGIVADFAASNGNGAVVGNGRTEESDKAVKTRMKETMKRLGVPDAGLDAASSIH